MEKIIENYINDFVKDLKEILNKLKVEDIKFDNPRLSEVTINITDNILEKEMKGVILSNVKTAYSPYTNTIYIDEKFVYEPQLRYHLTKRLLECITTKKFDTIISTGVSLVDLHNKTIFNEALNDAITENITNLMLFDSSLDEDTYKNNIIARKNLSKLEEIVGMDTIVKSYFNSDYMELEAMFNKYKNDSKVDFRSLALKMDRLKEISYGKKEAHQMEDGLAYQIDRMLITVYAQKHISEKRKIESNTFKEHIITSETVRSEFGDKNKKGYNNVDKNKIYYELLTSGLKTSNKLLMQQVKSVIK